MDETKLKDPTTNQPLEIEPINFCKPAEVKKNDQIYVIQYPHGGNLSLSASQCFVVGKDNYNTFSMAHYIDLFTCVCIVTTCTVYACYKI